MADNELDIVQEIIESIADDYPDLSREYLRNLDTRIRANWGGERVYIRKRNWDEIVHCVMMAWENGMRADEIGRTFNIDQRTVLKIFKSRESNVINRHG